VEGAALTRHETRWSFWLQIAIGLSIVIAIAGAVYHRATLQPQDTLYIELGELRSRAAEARRVADDAAAERLTGTFVVAQSQQLGKAIAMLRDELADTMAKAPSSDVSRAHQLSESLLALVQTLEQRGASVDMAADVRDRAGGIVDALMPLERAVRPS
jgi:hypothetical protein